VAEIQQRTQSSAKSTPGSKSQFDVFADGELIFSKEREGRFPEHDEILARL
jgi:selT/selW/selH-like putative selenoprotein